MEIAKNKKYSQDFILDLLIKRGSFTFSTRTKYNYNRERTVHKIPTFTLTMTADNEDIMLDIKNKLGLKNKLYKLSIPRHDGKIRKESIMLIVRELKNIERVIIPFFYKKYLGYRTGLFNNWLLAIERDPLVPFSFKKIYWRHKSKT